MSKNKEQVTFGGRVGMASYAGICQCSNVIKQREKGIESGQFFQELLSIPRRSSTSICMLKVQLPLYQARVILTLTNIYSKEKV